MNWKMKYATNVANMVKYRKYNLELLTELRVNLCYISLCFSRVFEMYLFQVVIAQDPSNESVKIFVRFADCREADVARQALDKRFFAGREISAQNYDQLLFDHNDYTG